MVTGGVTALPGFDAIQLMAALAGCEGFDEDNDPYREHDFGDVDLWGAELLWKIDYYDKDLMGASPNPADESVTARVLKGNRNAWKHGSRSASAALANRYVKLVAKLVSKTAG